jgi:hypothetical protein
MSVHLPLKDMTLHEKLEALELLWEDLARTAQSVESPDWHEKTLEERSQRVAQGEAHFTDWETAKAEIRSKLP